MIKLIAIEVTDKAFLPEAYAYRDHFKDLGYDCELVRKGLWDSQCYDAILLFHGFHPFWRKYPRFIIGEYHSLSVGRFSRLKDLIKRAFNVRANFMFFLNDEVRRKMWFSKSSPHALRGMGFESDDFERNRFFEKKYDIVYCGSFRKGLIECIESLADKGFTVAVVGFDFPSQNKFIKSFGRMTPSEARQIISQSKYGLNYTPNVFPLNIQDSTKVIEYCGAGLGVITNRYFWIDEFERKRKARFINLSDIKAKEHLEEFSFVIPDVSDLDWQRVVENPINMLLQHFN